MNLNDLFKLLDSKKSPSKYNELDDKTVKNLFLAFDNDTSKMNEDYSAELIFFNALYQAGLVSGVKNNEIDIDYAISLLEWGRDLDKENGVYSFYLAHLKELAHYPSNQVLEEYQNLFAAKYFSNHVLKISRYNLVKGLTSEAYFTLAVHINSQLPYPDMLSPWKTLKKYMGEQGDQFLKQSLKFSSLLQKEGLKYGMTHPEFSFWDAINFAIGTQVQKQVQKRNSKLLRTKIISYTDLLQSYQRTQKKWNEELINEKCPSKTLFRKRLVKEKKLFELFYFER